MTPTSSVLPSSPSPIAPHAVEDLPRSLSPDQVKSFVDQGFLAVPGLVKPEELQEIREEAVALARGKYPSPSLKPLPADTPADEVLRKILCIHQPHYLSPVLERYIRHPGICGVLSQICGAHLPFWDGRVKAMQSMLFIKPPGFQGQAWHQDEIYIPTRDRSLVGAWIALDHATLENGCLWALPGSHRPGYLYPQRPHGREDEFDSSPESHGFDEAAAVPLEAEPGTVLFFNGYLLHRSFRNRGTGYRRVLVNHYCNAWSLLPWFLREGETIATADSRCVVPVAGEDPYAWKGYEDRAYDVFLRPCKANSVEKAGADTREA